jgi:fatty-acyl-CoA synthase
MGAMKTNDIPLSPVDFLNRSADVFGDSVAVVTDQGERVTYSEFRRRASSLAHALRGSGLQAGDRVAVLAPNDLPLLESHYGVPATGCTLVALNTRLATAEYQYMLQHSQARALIVDSSLVEKVAPILSEAKDLKVVVEVVAETGPAGIGHAYEGWLQAHRNELTLPLPNDEREPISINYTSGTTAHPKGVVYSHRGAYLNAMGQALTVNLTSRSNYLWTLPMFHCNGWCFTWAVTAVGAVHTCLKHFDPDSVLEQLDREQVSHFCGAPVILNSLSNAQSRRRMNHAVKVVTGGAPPSPTVIARMSDMNIDVMHLYGLTETYGPSVICEPQQHWASLDPSSLAVMLSRQGVRTINVHEVQVVDEDLKPVANDGEAVGEIVLRSNTVMSGYLDDEEATTAAFKGGWLHTGDLAVMHPDGYIEIRDRAKDMIISGGENISSIEVENALASHPGVQEAAVVAVEHSKWGQVPVAFISLRSSDAASERELIDWTRSRLAHFKAPKAVYFMDLPKTSTGKIQKGELRRLAASFRVSP